MAESPNSPTSDYRPVLMKKKTVQLPPDEVLNNADPAVRWLIKDTVEQKQFLNDIVESANEQKVAVHKGFRRMDDNFLRVNGTVGRTKARVDTFEIEKQRQAEAEALRVAEAARIAKDAEDRAEEAKADRERADKFRKKILSRLGWLISTIGLYSGSSIFSKAVEWLPGGFATLLALLIVGGITGAAIVGISYGRKQRSTGAPPPE